MPKRILTGTVTSDANEQTVTVSVERRFTHPVLKKTIRKSKKYRAHDEKNAFKVGDRTHHRMRAEDRKRNAGKCSKPKLRRLAVNRNPGDQARIAPHRSGETK